MFTSIYLIDRCVSWKDMKSRGNCLCLHMCRWCLFGSFSTRAESSDPRTYSSRNAKRMHQAISLLKSRAEEERGKKTVLVAEILYVGVGVLLRSTRQVDIHRTPLPSKHPINHVPFRHQGAKHTKPTALHRPTRGGKDTLNTSGGISKIGSREENVAALDVLSETRRLGCGLNAPAQRTYVVLCRTSIDSSVPFSNRALEGCVESAERSCE